MRRRSSLKVNETDESVQNMEETPFLYEKTFENIRADSPESFIENNRSLLAIIENVPNGIAIVTPELKVIYINRKLRAWFAEGGDARNKKCYRLFHARQKAPCRECPARVCMETKQSASVIHYCGPEGGSKHAMYVHIHTFPILNEKEEVVAFVEYVYNLTEQKNTADLLSEMRSRLALLESENALLKKELESDRESTKKLEKTVIDNMNNYVKPALDYLGTRVSAEERKIFTSLIEESVFPITRTRSARGLELSSKELQIAMMIREGKSSKQIADDLYITKKAVDYHRANIRKKLGIDAKTSLQNYLRAYL